MGNKFKNKVDNSPNKYINYYDKKGNGKSGKIRNLLDCCWNVDKAVVLSDGRFLALKKHSIIIFDKYNYNKDIIIKDENCFIHDIIKIKNNFLIYGDNSGYIKVVLLENKTYTITQEIKAHKESIEKIIKLSDTCLITFSLDNNIIFFKFENNILKKYRTINIGHTIESLYLCKPNILLGSYCKLTEDNKHISYFIIYDINSNQLINKIRVKFSPNVSCIQKLNKKYYLIAYDNNICFLNMFNYSIKKRFFSEFDFGTFTSCCKINNKTLLLSTSEGDIHIYNINKNANLIKINVYKFERISIKYIVKYTDNRIIICGSTNGLEGFLSIFDITTIISKE